MNEHLEVMSRHDEKFLQIEKAISLLQSFDQKMIEVTSNQNASLERIHERLDDWNEQTNAIIKLGNSVEHMVEESKKTQETLEKAMGLIQDQHIRIRDIEQEKYEDKFVDFEKRLNEIDNRVAKKVLKYLDGMLIVALGAIALFILYKVTGGQIGG